MDPYPFVRGAVNVRHKTTTGMKQHSIRKEDNCPVQDSAASIQCKSLYRSAPVSQVVLNEETP